MSRFVIDASIVLTWCFPDENSALAAHAAQKFAEGHTALAPSFWPHEVLNALLTGEKRKRITSILARAFLDDLQLLAIALDQPATESVFGRVQRLSRECSLTSYDAAYLDLALQTGLPLATLDEDLIRACHKSGVQLLRP